MAEAYNGQQGDFFDSDKDMAIAALGALISAAILIITAAVGHIRRTEPAPPLPSSLPAPGGVVQVGR